MVQFYPFELSIVNMSHINHVGLVPTMERLKKHILLLLLFLNYKGEGYGFLFVIPKPREFKVNPPKGCFRFLSDYLCVECSPLYLITVRSAIGRVPYKY